MSQPLIVFPDAEALLVEHLTAALTAAGRTQPVGTEYPRRNGAIDPDREFVRIALVGGSRISETIDAPAFTIDCWAPNAVRAHETASLVRAHLHQMGDTVGSPVYGTTERNRPTYFPDPETGTPRYTQRHEIRIRGSQPTP